MRPVRRRASCRQKINTSQEVKGATVYFECDALVCSTCKGHYFDDELADRLAEAAANAYRKDNGLLTSDQIAAYRKKLNMSQAEFSLFLPIPIASLKRYELFGIQDPSADQLIRLKCDEKSMSDARQELEFRIDVAANKSVALSIKA